MVKTWGGLTWEWEVGTTTAVLTSWSGKGFKDSAHLLREERGPEAGAHGQAGCCSKYKEAISQLE